MESEILSTYRLHYRTYHNLLSNYITNHLNKDLINLVYYPSNSYENKLSISFGKYEKRNKLAESPDITFPIFNIHK